MKILILSGFLGAGKTTFLQQLVKHFKDVVILENDYARDVDRELLSRQNNTTYAIDEGCACCVKGEELEGAILTIANTLDPQYLIIEPTGLCSLSALIKRVKKVEYERIQYIGSIAIMEINRYKKIEETYPELYLDSIQNANYIIVSKSETASNKDFAAAADYFSKHSNAQVANRHYSQFAEDDWQMVINSLSPLDQIVESHYHYHAKTLTYQNVVFDDFQQMGTCFNAIVGGRFGKVMRAKGGVLIAEKPYKIDVVDSQFNIEPLDAAIDNLIFIGQNLDELAFTVMFEKHYSKK